MQNVVVRIVAPIIFLFPLTINLAAQEQIRVITEPSTIVYDDVIQSRPSVVPDTKNADSRNEQSPHCEPNWANEAELKIEGGFALLLTHFTDRLDTLHATQPGLVTLTNLSNANGWPRIYLHEANAPDEQYFYADCNATAYVNSSLGRFAFDTQALEHVVIAGGFYELCLNNTFSQVVENWSQIDQKKELRITFVMDAIYGVASDSLTSDEFNRDLRSWIQQQTSHTLLMSSVLRRIGNRNHVWKFLSRRWGIIPSEFGLHVRYKDEITAIRFASNDRPTIAIHYTTSKALADSINAANGSVVALEMAATDHN